jgi:hypothetical protein
MAQHHPTRNAGGARIAVQFVINYVTAALERFIDYAAGYERVWFARRIDIARHWIAAHPFAGWRPPA